MDANSVDLGALCAAVAQSAAALVAIVGGFILSQLLSLSSERSSLRARLQDIEAQLLAKQEELREARASLLRRDASELIDDALASLVKTRGQYSLAEAMVKHGGRGWDEEDLGPYWLEAAKTVQSAYRLREEHPEWLDDVFELDRRLRSLGLDPSWLEERIYQAVFLHEKPKPQPKPQKKTPWGIAMPSLPKLSIPMPKVSMPKYVPVSTASEAVKLHNLETYSELVRDVQAAMAEVGLLETQAEDLRNRLRLFVWPAGLGLGFAVLLCCALTGILYPLYLMTLPKARTPTSAPGLVLKLFALGLGLFFAYLAYMVVRGRRKLAGTAADTSSSWRQCLKSCSDALMEPPPAAYDSDTTS